MGKWQAKLQSFMKGRYGPDILSRDLTWLALALILANIFIRFQYMPVIVLVIILIGYLRMFSKNYSKRYNENRIYMNARVKITRPIGKFFKRIKDLPKYKYLKCPNCKREMRVPRGKKQIVVTCPQCRTKFDAKS
ncbi:hypothetical protein AOC36_00800 [Erysipelothrix larvae]|uniref:Zn-finger containing protein n=1 Tax=Erysipelothrix larvae TaxID=1514105 RepID=A0A109UGH2_9FIRM|nr:hypothetical protein [Erysipelothrix larvae]AMC92581.1 hypothetical protein AOC36_00800 [Erysipelothrix larvae]